MTLLVVDPVSLELVPVGEEDIEAFLRTGAPELLVVDPVSLSLRSVSDAEIREALHLEGPVPEPSSPTEAAAALSRSLSSSVTVRSVTVEVSPDGSTTLVVISSDPRADLPHVPLRHGGYPVSLRRVQMAPPAVRPVSVPVHAPAGAMVAPGEDALWDAVVSGSDPLGGMSFEAAVLTEPLRVESLLHQRIQGAFARALGTAGAEPAFQRDTWRLRNRALREVRGCIDAPGLADSLERNWEDYSGLLDLALRSPRGQVLARVLMQASPDLVRAFAEAREIAVRASSVCRAADRDDDAIAWASMAATTRAMAEFVLARMRLPVPVR